MVKPELLQYIVKEEHEGFSREVIMQALQTHGYTREKIEKAFQQLDSGHHDPHVHEYVQEYARQGMAAGQVFQILREQGFNPGDIKKSVANIYGTQTDHKTHTVAFMLLAVFVGAGGTWLMMAGITPDIVAQPQFSPSELISLAIQDAYDGGDGIASCRDKLDGIHLEKCYAVIAAATEDSTICSTISDNAVHDSCWMTFIDVEFSTVCNSVKQPENKQTCSSIRALQV